MATLHGRPNASMAKLKKHYSCSECGAESPKWLGKCPSCNAWNTMIEDVALPAQEGQMVGNWKDYGAMQLSTRPVPIEALSSLPEKRMTSGDAEFDAGLGGGLVSGSVTLLTGQPGIGKSTLMLQIALRASTAKVLYVSGEESPEQLKLRANRIGGSGKHCYILPETRVSAIIATAVQQSTGLLIVDSVQTLYADEVDSAPGSITQIRATAFQLIRFAKESGTPVILIGHINKEGEIAGPKLLEHMVDTVVHFEGEKQYAYRMLRVLKNRFGSTDALCLYEMQDDGLHRISNPSEFLLSQHEGPLSGSAIAATMEGSRPLLIEMQALVGAAVYGTPQRVANGFDQRRMAMLLAVLEKRCGFPLAQKDVFVNVAGGLRVSDPATDLAVVAAVISSLEDKALHRQVCFAAEVGLSGELRAVTRIDARIQEAARIGFKAICISKYNARGLRPGKNPINVVGISSVDELYATLFEKFR